MRAESVVELESVVRTNCGRCSCVILYRSEHCVFCEPAEEALDEALREYGLSRALVSQVMVDRGCECGCDADVAGVPAIRVCDQMVHGIPEEDTLRDLLLRAIMMPCFCDPTQ